MPVACALWAHTLASCAPFVRLRSCGRDVLAQRRVLGTAMQLEIRVLFALLQQQLNL